MTTTNYEDSIKARKKRNTRIVSIVVLSVVFAIAIFILISSLAMVDLNPKFVTNPDVIKVYDANTSTATGHLTSEDKEYKEFMSYYDEMFSSSFLSAMFSGRLGGYEISTINSCKDGNLYKEFDDKYVKFQYDEKQMLTYSNGKEYQMNAPTKKTLEFKELYFEINENNVANNFTIYVVDYDSSEKTTNTYFAKVTLLANTSEIYSNFNNFRVSLF